MAAATLVTPAFAAASIKPISWDVTPPTDSRENFIAWGKGRGEEHVTGISPNYEDLNWTGLDFSAEQFKTVSSMDKAAWQKELVLHDELFKQLAHHLPVELAATKAAIARRLAG